MEIQHIAAETECGQVGSLLPLVLAGKGSSSWEPFAAKMTFYKPGLSNASPVSLGCWESSESIQKWGWGGRENTENMEHTQDTDYL